MKRLLLLIIGCVFFYCTTDAQPYPVTTSLQVTSPYLPNLDPASISSSNSFLHTLLLTDQKKPTYQVKLGLKVSGEGVGFKTKSDYFPLPILLSYNVPLVLTGADLAPYFDPANLDFQGISPQAFISHGLPEGTYHICIEAHDLRRDQEAVSNAACAIFSIAYNDPPVITSPIGQQDEIVPQHYTFSWQPMHIGSFPVDYALRVYEKLPGLTDDQVLQLTAPVFETSTPMTTYNYGAENPSFVRYQNYLVQVQIRDLMGTTTFQNGGNSAPVSFVIAPMAMSSASCDDDDNDGVCNDEDECPGSDDNIDLDYDGIPDGCDICVEWQPCDDGDPCTPYDIWIWDDTYDPNEPLPPWAEPCICWGFYGEGQEMPDEDEDGVCDSQDQCPGFDDNLDGDQDGVPDGCDDCPGGDDMVDEDNDCIPDACDPLIEDICTAEFSCEAQFIHPGTAELCDYCAGINMSYPIRYNLLYNITVKIPGPQVLSLNSLSEFNFPYCLDFDEEGACPPSFSSQDDFIDDLNEWFESNNIEGYATDSPRLNHEICGNYAFTIAESEFEFLTYMVKEELGGDLESHNFKLVECFQEQPDFYSLTANIDCESPSFIWSTGETTQSISAFLPFENYQVTVTCEGYECCEYTSSDPEHCLVGAPCNDGDPCTVDDKIFENCLCIGHYVGDTDGDGVCDVKDICEGSDDYLDLNNNGIPDGCEDCTPGTPCDDGSLCTAFDTLDDNCNCVGIFQDSDGDLVCDREDQCEGWPDHIDFNNNGIPDGCDPDIWDCITLPCTRNDAVMSGVPPPDLMPEIAHALILTLCDCNIVEKVSLSELSHYLANPVHFEPYIDVDPLTGDITYIEGDLSFYNFVDMNEIVEGFPNVPLDYTLKDDDHDNVANFFDMCPGPDDDPNGNCIPDYCEDCSQNYIHVLQFMFNMDCDPEDHFAPWLLNLPVIPADGCDVSYDINCFCQCEAIIVDSDGDGICDDEDPCIGGDDTDIDNDGIPDACDPFVQCEPDNPTNSCDDGNDCTYGDYLQFNPDLGYCECVGMEELDSDGDGVCDAMDICHGENDLDDDDLDGIPNGCDLCPDFDGSAGLPCDDGDNCTILDEYVLVDEENGICACLGQNIDSDNDGVCDAEDQCEGFDDSLDFNNDGIPDGCDPPYYEIGCPDEISFSNEWGGLIMIYEDETIEISQLPNPIGVAFTIGSDIIGPSAQLTITSASKMADKIEVFYDIPDIGPNSYGLNVQYTGVISFSEHQECSFSSHPLFNDFDDNLTFVDFDCPEDVFVGGSPAAMKFNFKIPPMGTITPPIYDLTSIPSTFTIVGDYQANGGNFPVDISGSISGVEPTVLPFEYTFDTDIPIPIDPSIPNFDFNNFTGTITFDNGQICTYSGGNLPGCYEGQPCVDNDPCTNNDQLDADCNCVGEPKGDADNDTVCDFLDVCPGGDDLVDTDGDGIPDDCECVSPVIVSAEVVNGNDIVVTLEENGEHDSYTIHYFDDGGTFDTTFSTTTTFITIANLMPGLTYTISVTGLCDSGNESSPTEVEVEIPLDENAFACGLEPDVDLDNENPLFTLMVDDVFIAGDFQVVVTDVTGGGYGTFSGSGYIQVPYFNQIRINVTFNNIFINDEYIFVDGEIIVTGIGVAVISEELADAINNIVNNLEDINNVLGEIQTSLEQLESIIDQLNSVEEYFDNGQNILTNINTIIDQMPYLSQNVTDDVQNAMACMTGLPGNGNTFEQCQTDLTNAINQLQEALAELFDADYQIAFQPNTNQKYGFDFLTNEAYKDHYWKMDIAKEPYYVSWKSVKTSDTDDVNVTRKDGDPIPSDVTYEEKDQQEIGNGGATSLTVNGGAAHEEINEIFALQHTPELHVAGKLAVISYDEKPLEVVLVPINGKTYPHDVAALQTALNDVYKQAVVSVTVSLDNNLVVSDFDNTIDDESSGLLSNYTWEMKDIINAFENGQSVDEDKYYLFIVEDHAEATKLGFMPRKRQFGFMFNDNFTSEAEYQKVIAHELGHGAFILEHPWEAYPALSEGQTENLMDYGTNAAGGLGTHLHKHQWDLIHNPASVSTLFDDDDESEYVTVNLLGQFSDHITNGYYSFLNNHGQIISIKEEELISVKFATGGETFVGTTQLLPIGTLSHFTTFDDPNASNPTILEWFVCGDGNYYGEVNQFNQCTSGSKYNFDSYSGEKKPIIVRPCRIDSNWGINAVVLNSNTYTEPIPPALPEYDFLVLEFFKDDDGDGKYTHQGEFFENSNTEKYFSLSAEFEFEFFKEFIESNFIKNQAQYFKISSFYVNGFAKSIHSYSQSQPDCDVTGDLAQLTAITWAFDFVNENPKSEVINTFNVVLQFAGFSGTGNSHYDYLRNNIVSKYLSIGMYGDDFTPTQMLKVLQFYTDREYIVDLYEQEIADLNENNVEELIELFESLSFSLYTCEFESLEISYEKLKLIIKETVERNSTTIQSGEDPIWANWMNNSEESIVLKAINKIDPSDYEDFINFLETTQLTTDPNNTGWLWSELIKRVDDAIFADNNGRDLILKLTEIFSSQLDNNGVASDGLNNDISDRLKQVYAPLNSIETNSEDHIPLSVIDDPNLKVIPYNYRGFLNRVIDVNAIGFPGYPIYYAAEFLPVTDITDVSVNTDGTFNIYQSKKTVFLKSAINQSDSKFDLRAFDPVLVDHSSSFGVTKNFLGANNQIKVYPACVFYYFNEKAKDRTTTHVVFTTIDVLTLVLPVPKLSALSLAGKVLVISDKTSSILGIAGTYTEDLDPETGAMLHAFSALLGGIAFSTSFSKIKKIKDGDLPSKAIVELVDKNAVNKTVGERYTDLDEVLKSIENPAVNQAKIDQWKTDGCDLSEMRNAISKTWNEVKTHSGNITAMRINNVLSKLEGGFWLDIVPLLRTASQPASEQLITGLKAQIHTQADALAIKEILLANNAALIPSFNKCYTLSPIKPDLVEVWRKLKDNAPGNYSKLFEDPAFFTNQARKEFFDDFGAANGAARQNLIDHFDKMTDGWKEMKFDWELPAYLRGDLLKEESFRKLFIDDHSFLNSIRNINNGTVTIINGRIYTTYTHYVLEYIQNTSNTNFSNLRQIIDDAITAKAQYNPSSIGNETVGSPQWYAEKHDKIFKNKFDDEYIEGGYTIQGMFDSAVFPEYTKWTTADKNAISALISSNPNVPSGANWIKIEYSNPKSHYPTFAHSGFRDGLTATGAPGCVPGWKFDETISGTTNGKKVYKDIPSEFVYSGSKQSKAKVYMNNQCSSGASCNNLQHLADLNTGHSLAKRTFEYGLYRLNDSEARFIYKIWNDLPNMSGETITIISQRPPCPSCRGLIKYVEQQFNVTFNFRSSKLAPNIP